VRHGSFALSRELCIPFSAPLWHLNFGSYTRNSLAHHWQTRLCFLRDSIHWSCHRDYRHIRSMRAPSRPEYKTRSPCRNMGLFPAKDPDIYTDVCERLSWLMLLWLHLCYVSWYHFFRGKIREAQTTSSLANITFMTSTSGVARNLYSSRGSEIIFAFVLLFLMVSLAHIELRQRFARARFAALGRTASLFNSMPSFKLKLLT
jgi:hypothetical protein